MHLLALSGREALKAIDRIDRRAALGDRIAAAYYGKGDVLGSDGPLWYD